MLILAAAAFFVAAVPAAVLAASAPAGAQGYSPPGTITVTPPDPEAGDAVTVAVTGCAPAPGTVDVLIDGVFVGRGQVGAEGAFTADFIVPLEAAGVVGVDVRCDNGVLSSLIDVRIPDLPFQEEGEDGDTLPRTGSDGTVPLAQLGAGLLGVGCLALLAASRRREDEESPMEVSRG
jgi:LPXTG-motif cell wall-anchored protein